MDARDAPGGIVGNHLLDGLTPMSAEAWPSLTPATALSPPERPKSTLVSPDHGFGLDDNQRIPPALPDTAQKNPHHAVLVLQRRALPARVRTGSCKFKSDSRMSQTTGTT